VRGAITVSDLCDLYLADAKGRIKVSTLAGDRSRIETHVKPLIGRFTVRSLTTADIERMKADIIAGKTAKPRKIEGRGGVAAGGPGVAARTLGMTATILEYARKSLKLIKDNPARGVKKPPDRKQRRFLTIEEITKLGRTIELLNGEIFYSLKEGQIVIEQWRKHYNTIRPHSSLGYRPPAPQTMNPFLTPLDQAMQMQ
jgi:hypothetical protein